MPNESLADETVRVKCLPTDTVGDLKKLIAAQTGTTAQKIQLKKWYVSFLRPRAIPSGRTRWIVVEDQVLTDRYTNFKDHVTLQDYEINDGMVSCSNKVHAIQMTQGTNS